MNDIFLSQVLTQIKPYMFEGSNIFFFKMSGKDKITQKRAIRKATERGIPSEPRNIGEITRNDIQKFMDERIKNLHKEFLYEKYGPNIIDRDHYHQIKRYFEFFANIYKN